MDCLTDSNCITTVLDALNQFAATIDYCGYVLFGADWAPIGPGVEARTEIFARVFGQIFVEPTTGCIQYAMLGPTHA